MVKGIKEAMSAAWLGALFPISQIYREKWWLKKWKRQLPPSGCTTLPCCSSSSPTNLSAACAHRCSCCRVPCEQFSTSLPFFLHNVGVTNKDFFCLLHITKVLQCNTMLPTPQWGPHTMQCTWIREHAVCCNVATATSPAAWWQSALLDHAFKGSLQELSYHLLGNLCYQWMTRQVEGSAFSGRD